MPTACEARAAVRTAARAFALVICSVLATPLARAANPQPYRVDWVSSGKGAIDSTLKLTSQLQALRGIAPVGPYGLIARARGDVKRLRTVLESFGYYQGTVTITIDGMGLESVGLGKALDALPNGTDAKVRIATALGALFRVGRIEIEGVLPAQMQRTLGLPHALLGLGSGAPAVASDVLSAGERLQIKLQNAGYALAKVDPPVAYEDPARHVLNLKFHVTSGPRVRIGEIRIEGLQHVHASFIRRSLPIHTGQRYDAVTVEQARQDLLGLGLFSSVSVRLGSPDAAQRIPLTFLVRESKRYAFGVNAAYSSDLGGSGGLRWNDSNVFGGGQRLSASASAIDLGGTASTGAGYDARIEYDIPDFRLRGQTLGFSVAALRQTLQAYTQNGETAGVSLTRRFSRDWVASAGASYGHELITQEGQLNQYNLVALPLSARFDSTDLASPLLDPSHGYRISLTVSPTLSTGGSGQQVFIILQGSVGTYFDLHKLIAGDPAGWTVIATRLIAGVVEGASEFSLPPDQRFYAGGSGTVRGYRYQSIGPQFADGLPKGGTSMQAVNLELRQRVGAKFGFVLFADAGGVASGSSSVYRVGVGTGVRYYTSIGPVRLDVAVPTRQLRNGGRFEVYIGLGQTF
ncbi:MAG: autotransporter assembly complex protein TamA [Steroidobacteraceae bacterium]